MTTCARLASAILLAVCVAGTATAQTTLRYTEPSVNRGERAEVINWFGSEIAKRTNDAVKVQMFWGGVLMEAKASLPGVSEGAVELGSIVGSYTPREMQAYNVGDLPIGSSDVWVGLRAMYELSTTDPDLIKTWDAQGVVYLSNFTTTEIQLICKNKVLSKIEDFKGTKIRSAGFYGQVMRDLGANVLNFSGMEANRALDTGNIECNHNYLYGMRVLRDYEVANNVIRLDWGQHLAWAVIANKAAFKKLTPAQQKVLRDVGNETVDKVAEAMITANDNAVAAMTAGIDGKKVTVHPFPAAEKAKLLKAGEKYIEEWKTKTKAAGYDPDRILKNYLALSAKYEKEKDAKGYPWKRAAKQ